MVQTVVSASTGRDLGSRPSRRLRAEGKLPGVIYGLNKEPQAVSVVYTDLREALSLETGMNTVFTLDIDGSPETVLVRSVQRDPLKRVVTHADFLRIDPTQKIRVRVPIELVGDATAVTSEGGLIEQKMFEIELEVSPNNIPVSIKANLSIMTLDRRIAVADLDLPEGSTTLVPDNISVVAPVIPRSAKVDEEGLGEGLEGEEGEAGEGSDDSDSDDSGDSSEGGD